LDGVPERGVRRHDGVWQRVVVYVAFVDHLFLPVVHSDLGDEMNVNELADEVEMWGRDLLALNMKGGVPVIEGAKLLRQQQAEIEVLRKQLKAACSKLMDMQLKPKELTNEEIDEVLYSMDWAHDPVDFARAILKKANEK
jgi:hypothetical protein